MKVPCLAIKSTILGNFRKLNLTMISATPITNHVPQVLHLIFSWSSVLSWMLFVVDIGLIAFLAMHAYGDGTIISFLFLVLDQH